MIIFFLHLKLYSKKYNTKLLSSLKYDSIFTFLSFFLI